MYGLVIALRVAERELRAGLRSRSFLVQILLLPLVLTAIIGTALGGPRRIEPAPVALAGPTDEITAGLETALTANRLATVSRLSPEAAEAAVRSGRAVAAVIVPPGLARAAASAGARPVEVRVVADPASQVRAAIVEQVTRSYLARLEAGRAAALGAIQVLAPPNAETLGALAPRVRASVLAAAQNPTIEFTGGASGGRSAGLFGYYAVAFGVMCTLLSATMGAGAMLTEPALARLRAAPVAPATLLTGKFGALFATATLQLGVFVVATSLLFGVAWGPAGPVTLGVLAAAAGAAGLGAMVLSLARTTEEGTIYSLLVVLLMSLLGGSMWPVEALPGAAQTLSRFTYNRWAIEAFQAVSVPGLGLSAALPALGVLLGLALGGLTLGAARLSRRFAP